MRSKVRQNKFGENCYCKNYFIKKSFCHTFPVNVWRQKEEFRNSKERMPSLVPVSCENELICLFYEGESTSIK